MAGDDEVFGADAGLLSGFPVRRAAVEAHDLETRFHTELLRRWYDSTDTFDVDAEASALASEWFGTAEASDSEDPPESQAGGGPVSASSTVARTIELDEWLALGTWDETWQYLIDHPEFVTAATAAALRRRVADQGEDSATVEAECVALVERALVAGVPVAVREHRLRQLAEAIVEGRAPDDDIEALHRAMAHAVMVGEATWMAHVFDSLSRRAIGAGEAWVMPNVIDARLQAAGVRQDDVSAAVRLLQLPRGELLEDLLRTDPGPDCFRAYGIIAGSTRAPERHAIFVARTLWEDGISPSAALLDAAVRLPEWLVDASTGSGAIADVALLWEHRVVSDVVLDAVLKLAEVAPDEQLASIAAQIGARVPPVNAVRLLETACSIRQHLLGERHPDTLGSLNNLASIYESVGRLDDAVGLFEEAYGLRVEVLGERHPDTLTSLNNLASIYESVGRLDDAVGLYEEGYRLCVEVLGERHPDTLTSLNNLAYIYRAVGRLDDAVGLYEEGYGLFVEVLGERHPNTLTSLNNLASIYESVGRLDDAAGLYEEAYRLRVEVLGERHPDTLTSLNNLAGIYLAVGRLDDATGLYEDAYRLRVEVLGDRHPDTLTSLNNLAGIYESVGRFDDAAGLYEDAYRLFVEVLGERHPNTLGSLNNLAYIYRAVGRFDDAAGLYEEGYRLFVEVLGERHPDTLTSLNNLASIYRAVGRLDDAVGLYEEGYGLCVEVLGERHPNTLTSLNNLAGIYLAVGRLDDATGLYEDAYRLFVEMLGDRHPDTLTSLNNLAGIYESVGRLDDAVGLSEEAYGLCVDVLGERHPNTLTSLNNLAVAADARGGRAGGRALRTVARAARRMHERGVGGVKVRAIVDGLAVRLALLDLDLGEPEQAVSDLELIRAVRLSDLASRSSGRLDRLAAREPDLVSRYRSAADRLSTVEAFAEADPESARAHVVAARNDYDQAIDAVIAADPDFRRDTTSDDLRVVLDHDEALVYLVPASADRPVTGIVVSTDGVTTVEIADVSSAALGRGLRHALWSAHGIIDVHPGVAAPPAPTRGGVGSIESRTSLSLRPLLELCGRILAPVLASVDPSTRRIALVPTGPLGLLPMHAALDARGKPFLADYELRTLLLGADLLEPVDELAPGGAAAVVASPHSGLACTAAEGEAISHLRGFTIVNGPEVDGSTLHRSLADSVAVHAALHGTVNPRLGEPHLSFGDPNVAPASPGLAYRLSDAQQLRQRRRHELFLAACSARTPSLDLPDEVLGFPNAFLSAGYRAVVSAGWPVNDLAAALTAIRYHELRSEQRRPAAALRDAQLWLSRLTTRGARDYVEVLAGRIADNGGDPTELRALNAALAATWHGVDDDARPFAHPVHWAAFSVIGS